ncbi:MAG: GAF domain-containing protein, partial [Anaerolineae bacterium]|nr:GAF domain-containing protein [Anaerolineae bacterium]
LALTILVLLATGIALVAYAVIAWDWQQQPFLGFLPTRALEVTGSQSLIGADWPARDAGIQTGDRLTELDGVALGDLPASERLGELNRLLADHQTGDEVTIRFLRDEDNTATPEGGTCVPFPGEAGKLECTLSLTLAAFPNGDLAGYFGAGWVLGVLLWGAAIVMLVRRRGNLARLVAALGAVTGVFLAGHFDAWATHQLTWVWLLAIGLEAGLLVTFGLEFPYRFASVQQVTALRWAPLIAAAALGGASIALYRSTDVQLGQGAFVLAFGALLLGLIGLGGLMLWRRGRSASPIARNQATLILIGIIPALLPALLGFGWLLAAGRMPAGVLLFGEMLPVLFPLTAMYAVSQFRLVDTDRVITQTALYSALLGLLMLSYWLVVTGIAMLIGRALRDTALHPLLIAVSIFVVAVLFTPVRIALQRLIESAYFRTRRAYQRVQERFTREATNAVTLPDVMELVSSTLADTLNPTHVIMFVRDIVTGEYRPETDPATGQRPTDITFTPESGLVRHLSDRASLLYLEEGRPLPLDVVSDRAKLAVLGAPVIVRLKGPKTLNGFLVIGPRQGGAPYLHEDLRFIETLSDQIALAVERAQVVDDLARRVRVQDVLSQVSRALNFAIDFDTLLELVYAQTTRVINAPNFYIALRNPLTDELGYVFYNEGDERLEAMERKRWRMGLDLMSEIARTRQTLATDDYVRESLARDPQAQLDNPHLKAWMGVPLLADTGGGVLGVMVAATTEPGGAFSEEQQDLFWDIANLAASAIDRLQLFEKTQERARQLSAINAISSQLAAELGNVDRLLRLITENAVQILGAEAGSLLLVDEETEDLIFHVVVGGAGEGLIGTRIPAGSGLVGATVQRGEPIIVNDPARDSRWFGDVRPAVQDGGTGGNGREDSGFRSNAILSVPLLVQGRAIGVLQTINKRDGSIFVTEDADLLATFAGQAAIAIENARLFDMTDQQLALRVQELDTMQRIDQELNRTLNLKNVVDITMDWALRKSGAAAGALFFLDRERNLLSVIASYGYPRGTPNAPSADRTFPADRGIVGRVIRSGQPSLVTDVSIDPDY